MPELDFGPDLADLLAADGTLDLNEPQTTADVSAALVAALSATYQAYRVAYKHADGKRDDDTVDALDMASSVLRDAISDLPA